MPNIQLIAFDAKRAICVRRRRTVDFRRNIPDDFLTQILVMASVIANLPPTFVLLRNKWCVIYRIISLEIRLTEQRQSHVMTAICQLDG